MDDLNRTVDRLVEANALLTHKLEHLITFLRVCPQCLSGHVTDRQAAPDRLIDTWSQTVTFNCSNRKCTYTVIKPNPHYKLAVPAAPQQTSDDEFTDLFG